MDRKKFLIGAVFVMLIIGLVGATTPFVSSMSPNPKAESALERLDISKIPVGIPKIFKGNPTVGVQSPGYSWSILLFKKQNGEVRVFNLPQKGLNTGLPDIHWYRPHSACSNFGPTLVGGLIDESAPIKCHDYTNDAPWWASGQWDLNGKAITSGTPDMLVTSGKVEGKYFVFGKYN